MALLLAWQAPLAASPFLVPLLGTSVLTLVLALYDRGGVSFWWWVVSGFGALLGAVYLAGLAPLLEETQGYLLAPAFYVPVGFSLLLFAPLLIAAPKETGLSSLRLLQFGSVAALLLGLMGLMVTPLYTQERPQMLGLRHVQDLDRQQASWWVFKQGKLPTALTRVAQFEQRDEIVEGLGSLGLTGLAADAPVVSFGSQVPAQYDVEVLETPVGAPRQVVVRLRTDRPGALLRLLVDRRAGLRSVRIEDRTVEIEPRDTGYEAISVYAPPREGVELRLELESADVFEHVVMDVAHVLPEEAAALKAARAPLGAPAHSGDRSFVIRRISF